MKTLWKKYLNMISRLYEKKIDATGLSIFRIVYAIVFLCEIVQLYYFRAMIFDKVPLMEASEIDFSWALKLWMVVIVFILIGFCTRWATVINYILSLTFLATINSYEYHMFYVYMLVNFLLIFLSVSKVNSIDRLISKLRFSNTHKEYLPSTTTSVLNYHILVFLSTAFVYFDSIFFKLSSKIWMNGLGMWWPASTLPITHIDNSFFLNMKWLMLTLGYLTVLFEAIFIFVFFRKSWRVPIMIIGIGLHIGILIEFPIPWFALGVSGCYLLMVPVSWWRLLKDKLSFKSPSITIWYNTQSLVHIRTKIIIKHFDLFNAIQFKELKYNRLPETLSNISEAQLNENLHSVTFKGKVLHGTDLYLFVFRRLPSTFFLGLILQIPGIYHIFDRLLKELYSRRATNNLVQDRLPQDVDNFEILKNFKVKDLKVRTIAVFLLTLSLIQTTIIYRSWFVQNLRISTGIMGTRVDKAIDKTVSNIEHKSKILLGITHHAVFMEYHFDGYNHVIGIEGEDPNGRKYWLPIVDKNGMPDKYIYGFNWVKWTFRVNGPNVNDQQLKIGVRDFTNFWAKKHGLNINSMKYRIYVKKIDSIEGWEYDFLRRQMKKPWNKIGEASWSDGQFVWSAKEIEKI